MKFKSPVALAYSTIKIVGGKWKGRKIFVPCHTDVRPTTSCMRETLFHWLYTVIPGAICLDCFAGSGALGLEALSRGARKVTFLECNRMCVMILLKTIRTFKVATYDREIIYTDSLLWINKLNEAYNVIFIDPPFKNNIISKFILSLEQSNCFQKKSWIYIEISAYQNILDNILIPNCWILYRKKMTKNVKYYLYLRNV